MTKRYCPQCESPLIVQSQPTIQGFCSKCNWTGGLEDFLTEFKPSMMSRDSTHWTPYVSIDLKTTGLDEEYCQILEFGAVIDDWHSPIEELSRFHKYIWPRAMFDGQPYVSGQPYALALNAEILRKLASGDPAVDAESCDEDKLGMYFATWLKENNLDPKRITASGKNFSSFDLQFLRELDGFSEHVNFKHRAIDPAIFFWRPDIDPCLPSTKECLERAGLDGRVAHTAIEDCISVIQLVRRGVRKCGLSVAG